LKIKTKSRVLYETTWSPMTLTSVTLDADISYCKLLDSHTLKYASYVTMSRTNQYSILEWQEDRFVLAVQSLVMF